jgi:hypothetical protein
MATHGFTPPHLPVLINAPAHVPGVRALSRVFVTCVSLRRARACVSRNGRGDELRLLRSPCTRSYQVRIHPDSPRNMLTAISRALVRACSASHYAPPTTQHYPHALRTISVPPAVFLNHSALPGPVQSRCATCPLGLPFPGGWGRAWNRCRFPAPGQGRAAAVECGAAASKPAPCAGPEGRHSHLEAPFRGGRGGHKSSRGQQEQETVASAE